MENVFAAFPKRPFRVTWFRQTIGAKILAVFGLLCLAGIYVADALYVLPAVIDDVRYSDAPYVPAKFDDGNCQSKLIISICDVKFKYRPEDESLVDKELHYLYLFGDIDSDGPFTVRMAPGRPDHISTSWGQAGVINRVISQLVIFGIGVGLIFAGFRERRRLSEEAAAQERISQRPQPTFVTIKEHKVDKRSGVGVVTYTWEPQGKPAQTKKARFPKGTGPFMLDATHMLALTDGVDVAAVDSALANVELTQQERQAVIAASRQQSAAS